MNRLTLLYVAGDHHGYGRTGHGLAAALRRCGVDVTESRLLGTADAGSPPVPTAVTWINSPFHALGRWEGQRPTLLTMWETDRLPGSFSSTLRHYETVMVPNDENLELFGAVHPDVRRVNLGFDAAVWRPTPRRSPDDVFRFLLSGNGPRKGVDLAHEAFAIAFPLGSWGDGPVPELVLKSSRERSRASERVRVIDGSLPTISEVALYAGAHCYVGPSRGEGFGLQPLQAVAQGLPTILTAAHGHAAYAHLGIPISARKVRSTFFAHGDAGCWWEADLAELAAAMRWVYEHYDEACARAACSAVAAARSFTWDHAADQLLAAIGAARLAAPPVAPTTWVPFEQPQYEVITRRDWTIPSAGWDQSFVAGQPARAPGHVKRILYEANLLDPACLTVPTRRLSGAELDALPAAQREEYLGWVVEAKRSPG